MSRYFSIFFNYFFNVKINPIIIINVPIYCNKVIFSEYKFMDIKAPNLVVNIINAPCSNKDKLEYFKNNIPHIVDTLLINK